MSNPPAFMHATHTVKPELLLESIDRARKQQTPCFLDIETIPVQNEALIQWMLNKHNADLRDELAKATPHHACKSPEAKAKSLEEKRQSIIEGSELAFKEQILRTSLDGGLGQVAVIGLAFGDEPVITLFDAHWQHEGYERHLLESLKRLLLERLPQPKDGFLVGHNLIQFDRRFLRQRTSVLGIAPHPLLTLPVRPWGDPLVVFDTMGAWFGNPQSAHPGERISLDRLCTVLGVEGKGIDGDGPAHGGQVWDYVQAGKIDAVARYCAKDIECTRAVYHRLSAALLNP